MSKKSNFALGGAVGFVTCAAIFSFAGCKGGGATASAGGNDVAVVNGTPITDQEFSRYMMMKPTVRVVTPQGPATMVVQDSLGFQAFDDLVKQKLLAQIARDEGMYPTSAEVDKEIQFREQQNPNFVRQLTSRGLTLDMIRGALELEIAQQKLLTKGVTVTSDEVNQYIKDNPDEFTRPASAQIYWIFAKSEQTKKQADEELKRGQPFNVIAERFSEAAQARRNKGRFPIQAVNQLPTQLRPIIEKTPALKSTEWLKLQDGWAKFYVESKTAAKPSEINDLVRESVKRRIALRRGRAANDLESRLSKKLRESTVDVKYTSLQDPWKRYMETVKETTPAGQATAPATDGAEKAKGG